MGAKKYSDTTQHNFYDRTYYADGLSTMHDEMPQAHRARRNAEHVFYQSLATPGPGESLLDVGCGAGHYLASLEPTTATLCGMDVSKLVVEQAQWHVRPETKIFCGTAEFLPFPESSFDHVTAWGVVEHVTHTDRVVGEIYRVVKPRGQAVLMMPNVYYYKFVWDALRTGRGPAKHQEPEMLYACQEWRALIERAGFTVQRVVRHNKFNKPKLRWFRNLLIPFYLSNHFAFVCHKPTTVSNP